MNILIVGLGSIARKHIKALIFLGVNVNLYALRSIKPASEELNITNIYKLESTKIKYDFVIISNPTYLHFNTIKKISFLNIPIFIEKPPFHYLDDAEKSLKHIESNNLITYVACNLRFHPCISFLKKRFEKEFPRINEINVYCGSYLPTWRPGKDFRKSYSVNSNMGGGVHLDLFHELDYITWLFDMPQKSHSVLRNVSSLDIDAIDYANYILEYETFSVSIILNYFRRKPKRGFEIVFEDQTWCIDLLNNSIIDDKGLTLFEAKDFKISDTYHLQLDYFLDALKMKKAPMNSIKESIEVLKICLKNV